MKLVLVLLSLLFVISAVVIFGTIAWLVAILFLSLFRTSFS